jgi:hypothetical protein
MSTALLDTGPPGERPAGPCHGTDRCVKNKRQLHRDPTRPRDGAQRLPAAPDSAGGDDAQGGSQ